MTLSPWIIYLWGIADNVREASATMSVLILIGVMLWAVGVGIASFIEEENYFEDKWKLMMWPLAAGILGQILTALLPSSKTIAVMVIVPAILNSEPIQKDLPEIYQMAKDALKQTLQPSK